MNVKEEIINYFKTKLQSTLEKDKGKIESWTKEEEEKYEKWVYGLSVSSFIVGLGIATVINKRRGVTVASKLSMKTTRPKLQSRFDQDPMSDAKSFAVKTFALGTLLCATVFTISGATVSYFTGASTLKEFSILMKETIGGQLIGTEAKQNDNEVEKELEMEKLKDEDLKEFLEPETSE